jgi:hypothetical protein
MTYVQFSGVHSYDLMFAGVVLLCACVRVFVCVSVWVCVCTCVCACFCVCLLVQVKNTRVMFDKNAMLPYDSLSSTHRMADTAVSVKHDQ